MPFLHIDFYSREDSCVQSLLNCPELSAIKNIMIGDGYSIEAYLVDIPFERIETKSECAIADRRNCMNV